MIQIQTDDINGQYFIDFGDELSSIQKSFIREIFYDNRIDSLNYILRITASAFLQCDHDNYTRIEFWSNDVERIQPFIDYLNNNLFNII